ncbi:MAG: non-homologous end-joining DNA ligase [Actinomycetota bacterium]|nr:non-homologous end-joining DNA ligase [Actinomycetota bacterium]
MPSRTGTPLPERIEPMLATLGELPEDQAAWGFEFKWDGVRTIAICSRDRTCLLSRRGRDVSVSYPELSQLGGALSGRDAVLDGEVVALGPDGRPSFTLLQRRMGVSDVRAAALRAHDVGVVFLAFDLLHLDRFSLLDLPYAERRAELGRLELADANWQTPLYRSGDGETMLDAARGLGLEGVVAKRLDSVYEPGRRSRAWRKVKLFAREEFVVGGWLPGQGSRERLGALLLGRYDLDPEAATRHGRPQRLVYAGSVGTGLSEEEVRRLRRLLDPLTRATSPFEGGEGRGGAVWVEPQLVVEVAYREWTPAGVIRHPAYAGLRGDKPARHVAFEEGH